MLTVKQIREKELQTVLDSYGEFITGKSLLEIGSGKGEQLQKFKEICKSAVGVDVQDGSCSTNAVNDIVYYDGQTLPFEDNTFDVIFSSNVLEHIQNLPHMEKEFQRVLKDDGVAIHVLPNAVWRSYTMLLHYVTLPYQIATFVLRRIPFLKQTNIKLPGAESPQVVQHTKSSLILDLLMARRHGETGNRLTEVYYFRSAYWKKHFEKCSWKNIEVSPSGIFYSNFSIGLSASTHVKLSKVLGSGTSIFKMTNK